MGLYILVIHTETGQTLREIQDEGKGAIFEKLLTILKYLKPLTSILN